MRSLSTSPGRRSKRRRSSRPGRSLLFLVLLLAAIWAGVSRLPATPPPPPALPADHLPVPLVRQATDYSCGAAVMQAVLYYWNAFDGRETALYPALKTRPTYGTDVRDMVMAVPKWGLTARLKQKMTFDDLKEALAQRQTVILDLQAWLEDAKPEPRWKERWEDGHYVVLVGMDSHYVYVMDPSIPAAYGYIPRSELYERWHDYEKADGSVWRNERLGIVIHGDKPRSASYPAELTRVL